ncbi:MAG: isochorismate synthase [Bacteroidota bacterium]
MEQTVHPQISEAAEYLDQLREVPTSPLTPWLNKQSQSVGQRRLLSFSFRFPNVDPLAYLEQQRDQNGRAFYWEQPSNDMAIAAGPALFELNTRGPQRFATLQAIYDDLIQHSLQLNTLEHSLSSPLLLSGFAFDNQQQSQNPWKNYGSGQGYIPTWSLIREGQVSIYTIYLSIDREFEWATDTASVIDHLIDKLSWVDEQLEQYAHQPEPINHGAQLEVQTFSEDSEYESWISRINKAKAFIEAQKFEKIVLARRQHVQTDRTMHPTRILNQLRNQYPGCYSFMFRQASGATFLGSTPERLGAFYRSHILTEGLAGSINRGQSATEDAFYEQELRNSSKNLREHAYVVDAIKDRLEPWSDRIQHPQSPGIKKLSNVQHLHTPITAWMNHQYRPLELVGELHPTPAVGGHPRSAALPYISKLENFDRGWYAAPVGWINGKGRGEFAVAIRSALICDQEAWLFAGCGIVADSDPQEEWEETKLKFIPMKTALRYG